MVESSSFICFRRKDRTMSAKLLLSRDPYANPLHDWKCQYVPLSVLNQHWFGSLLIWSDYRTMCFGSDVDKNIGDGMHLYMLVMSKR